MDQVLGCARLRSVLGFGFFFFRGLRAVQGFWAYDSIDPWCTDAPRNTCISFRGIIEGLYPCHSFHFSGCSTQSITGKKYKILNFPYIIGYTYLINATIL
jgi:hypothetical protein